MKDPFSTSVFLMMARAELSAKIHAIIYAHSKDTEGTDIKTGERKVLKGMSKEDKLLAVTQAVREYGEAVTKIFK